MLKSTPFIFMSELCITVACFCIFNVVYQIHFQCSLTSSLSLSLYADDNVIYFLALLLLHPHVETSSAPSQQGLGLDKSPVHCRATVTEQRPAAPMDQLAVASVGVFGLQEEAGLAGDAGEDADCRMKQNKALEMESSHIPAESRHGATVTQNSLVCLVKERKLNHR